MPKKFIPLNTFIYAFNSAISLLIYFHVLIHVLFIVLYYTHVRNDNYKLIGIVVKWPQRLYVKELADLDEDTHMSFRLLQPNQYDLTGEREKQIDKK